MAAGVVHDVNNLLTVISTSAGIARASDDPAAAGSALLEIEEVVKRAATLARRVLEFSHDVPVAPGLVDVNDVVGRAEPLIRALVGGRIRVQLRLEAGPRIVCVDAARMEQALLNLVANAGAAMTGDGVLRVAVEDGPTEQLALARSRAADGNRVCVSVTDSGVGIPPRIRDRVFEPFFTTRSGAGGTGLGLPSVLEFARQSGGSITVDSEPGVGSTFSILLPLAAATA